ncbi:phage tail tube protein [Falsihalocynthiibacter sp. CO-5D18]|uniref:phage tail tube protein n=1 Tax=Falsihalocynthiibacter sp. CO-5D18 TaxID=3240872 RepID=UPI003510C6E8
MAFTVAGSGMGSIFSLGDGIQGGSITYTDVGEVTNIDPPSIGWNTDDATHLLSTNKFEEAIKTTMTSSDAGFGFNYVASASDVLVAAAVQGDGDFQLTYPNGVKLQFSGIITEFKPGAPSTGKMAGSITIKPTSLPVFVAA